MKPPIFDYVRADSAADAAALLAIHGAQARILAGGQTLMAVLNMRLAQPRLLIDISQAESLQQLRVVDGWLEVGAAVTHNTLQQHPGLERDLPLLAQALPWIAHLQIRNRGTVCGSIAHADPSAELPLCLVALDGRVLLRSVRGTRELGAQAFFTGLLSTACAADELIEAVRFPLAKPGQGFGFREFAQRHGDFALCAVAAVATAEGLRVAVGGVADRPIARDFAALHDLALDDALQTLAWDLQARDEGPMSAHARRHLVRTLARQAIEQARTTLAQPARSAE